MRKLSVFAGAAAMLLMATAGRLEAASFTVAGSTDDAFNGTADPTLGPLSFLGSGFSFTTEYDDYYETEYGGTSEFGEFSLGSDPYAFSGKTFSLSVLFTLPGGSIPNPTTVSANLVGKIGRNASGQVTIDYGAPATVVFESGSFDLFMNKVTLGPNQSGVKQTGYVVGTTTVPEPGTLLLLSLGAGAMGITRRRKALATNV